MMKNDRLETLMIGLLYMNATETKFGVTHPFCQMGVTMDLETKQILDLRVPEHFEIFKKQTEKQIKKCDSIFHLTMLLSKNYHLSVLDYCIRYKVLNAQEIGEWLSYTWQHLELPHTYSSTSILRMFRMADKDTLMDEEEMEVYNNLPELVEIYRGVRVPTKSIRNGKVPKKYGESVCWTTDLDEAEWFAERFKTTDDTAVIYSAVVPRKVILAAFTSEDEVVVDFKKLNWDGINIEILD